MALQRGKPCFFIVKMHTSERKYPTKPLINLKYEFMGALFYANPPLFSSYAEQSIGKLKGAEAINQVTLP